MAVTVFNEGLDLLATWGSDTFRFLLLKGSGYVVNRDDNFVSALVPASNEVNAAGYSRQTAGAKTRTVDDTLNRITYDCADPSFGTIVAGNTITGMVLYKFVTVDADSPLIAHYPLGSIASAGLPFPVAIAATGVAYNTQG